MFLCYVALLTYFFGIVIIKRNKIIKRINGSDNERITKEKYSYKRLFHGTVKPHTSQTTNFKQLLDEVFVISRMIKVEAEVIG